MGSLGLVIVAALAASALFANVIAPHDPSAIDIANRFARPSAHHLLGTDQLGRDVFSRTLYGGRIALIVALVSTGSAAAIGIVIGLIAAYGPRVVDNAIVVVLDTMRCYPTIIFALAVGPLFGAGLSTVIAIMVVTTSPFLRAHRAHTDPGAQEFRVRPLGAVFRRLREQLHAHARALRPRACHRKDPTSAHPDRKLERARAPLARSCGPYSPPGSASSLGPGAPRHLSPRVPAARRFRHSARLRRARRQGRFLLRCTG